MVAKALATTTAIAVIRHGCQLMAAKDSSKDARAVRDISTLFTFGRMITANQRKTKDLRTMENIISRNYAKLAKLEYASCERTRIDLLTFI